MKIAILGASRGLGKNVVDLAVGEHDLFVSSRKIEGLNHTQVNKYTCDFSKVDQVDNLIKELKIFSPDKLWYFAGGGPYGNYAEKNFKDHLWAWNVSFLTPAKLIHSFLNNEFAVCEQMVVVGSAIAEDQPDPRAASYCSAKHALKGLLSTVQLESIKRDLRLFSPGYLDTEMLPPSALPRQQGVKIQSPKEVAKVFWDWALNSDDPKYLRYKNPIKE